jgi:hypothetical protein
MAVPFEFAGVVRRIMPRANDTLVNMGPLPTPNPLGSDNIRLQLQHPNYSTIFTILAASAANQRPVHCRLSPLDVGGENFWTIEWVYYDFF